MTKNLIFIRPFKNKDETEVVGLWKTCRLTVPWNDPYKDIARKKKVFPELFLVGILERRLIASVMGGYDGHRGWINYLAVHPEFQNKGFGTQMLNILESKLIGLGCPKVNLHIREGNDIVTEFYKKIGYISDNVTILGKRLEEDL